MFQAWPALDLDLLLFINRELECGVLTFVLRLLTDVDCWLPVLALFAVWLVWWGRTDGLRAGRVFRARKGRNGRFILLVLLLSVSLTDFGSNAVKHAVARPRPCRDRAVEHLVEQRFQVHGNRSFPSAHAANSAAMATVVSLSLSAPAGLLAWVLAFLVGFSRVYLGVHYPLDVAAGWVLGVSSGMLFWGFFRREIFSTKGMFEFTAAFRHGVSLPRELPGEAWEPFEFDAVDGLTIEGHLRRSTCDELVVLVHGLNGSCFRMSSLSSFFGDLGFSVLLLPLRGHDRHPARRCTGGVEECYDLIGALEAALDAGWKPGTILVYGSSMGAVTALRSASLIGSGSQSPLMGVVAHAPYVNFGETVLGRLGTVRSGLLLRSIPGGARRGLACLDIGLYCSLIDPSCPVVYLVGEADRLTPVEDAQELKEVTPCSGLVVMEERGHPRWLYGDRMSVQERVAIGEAVRRIRSGDAEGAVLVDASGHLHDDTGSTTNRIPAGGHR